MRMFACHKFHSLLIVLFILPLSVEARFNSQKSWNGADNYDETIFVSLPDMLNSDRQFNKGVVYEISDNWRVPVAGFGNGRDVLIKTSWRGALVRPYSADYAAGDLVEGHYFRFCGNERYADSKIAQEIKLPLLVECSPREAARYDEDKQRRIELMEQKKHEKKRWEAVMKALEGIDGLVEDERIKQSAYEKTASVYDDAYVKYKAHEKASGFALEFGRRILKGFVDEKERQMREWEAAHPEVAAARRKAEAERLARIAKEKLDREIKKTRDILGKFEADLKQYAEKNPKCPIPEKFSDLAKTLGARVLPPYDSWNNRLAYECDGRLCSVISAGVDEKFGTADDLRVTVSLQPAQSPKPTNLATLCAELDAYKCEFAQSVCGFTFGAKPEHGKGYLKERVVPMRKSFRGIENALLIYEGEYVPRLVAIRLIGIAKNDHGTPECEKILALLERNYDIKIPRSTVFGYIRAEYTNKGFTITVRNDNIETTNGEPAYLIEFRDGTLSRLISKIDALMLEKERPVENENCSTAKSFPDPAQNHEQKSDDDGLEALNL